MRDDQRGFTWGATVPELHAGDVCLRAPADRDAAALVEILGDQEALKYWAGELVQTHTEATRLLDRIRSAFDERRFFQWAICRSSDGPAVGLCKLYDLKLNHGVAALGFSLQRTHWGQGVMKQSLTAVLAFAFESLNLRRIEAFTHPDNRRALATLARQGFVVEGMARAKYVGRSGPQDAVLLGLLRSEWAP